MRPVVFIFAVLLIAAAASADKIEPSVYRQSTDYVKVIIKADETALPLIASVSHEYENFTGGFYAANISKINFAFLENSAGVKKVWLERKSRPLLDVSAPLIGASGIWQYYNGFGVKVCVIDTGMNSSHPALAGRIVAERDFVLDDEDGNSTNDIGTGHGTHVAGIVGSGDNTYRGIAPGVSLLNAKVFYNVDNVTENSFAPDPDIMRGIDWCIAQGAHVLTLSLGGADGNNDGSDALSQYLDYAVDQEKIVTVSAGNAGPDAMSIQSPGLSHKAITVGSGQTGKLQNGSLGTQKNVVSEFSSRGPTGDGRIKPDIIAPGEWITSASSDGGFVTLRGTSMAAPHIAGVAALALQARGNLTPAEFKALLMNTADGREKNNSYGAGVVNVSRLLGEINYTVSAIIGNYSRAHNIFVPDGSSELRATLYWPENYSEHNNLDLLLYDPSGTQRNASLSINNTDEKIIFSNPSSGYWKLVVNGTYVNGTQKYALASSIALSGQLFLFSASINETTYHELNVTNTTIEISIDWTGNATVNALLYNYSSLVSVLPENRTRLNFSLSGGTGLWILKIIPNQTLSYSVTSNNKILNQLANAATKINITNITNGTYLNESSLIIHKVLLNRRVQTSQECTYNMNNLKINFTYNFDSAYGFINEVLPEGSNEVNVTCIDDNGLSSFSSIRFFVDTIFPAITNISDDNGRFLNRNYTFVNVTVNETNPFR